MVCVPPPTVADWAAEPRGGTHASRRVVVVDDNRGVADSVCLLLEALGVAAGVAYDGASALALCERWRPTHVLIDLSMPGIDGYEVARQLRRCCAGEPLRLIAMTGWEQQEHRSKAQAAGFDQYLTKPMSGQSLKAAIAR